LDWLNEGLATKNAFRKERPPMSVKLPNHAPDEYCSLISRGAQEDPIGTAPQHRRYLFVEVPQPWERKAADSRHFPAGLKETLARCEEKCLVSGGKFRFLSFSSDTLCSPAGHVRVFYFWRPDFPCSRYLKKEYVVPERELNHLVEALLLEEGGRVSGFDQWLQPSEGIRELFVCTHGSHDRCCGRFGVQAYRFVETEYGGEAVGTRGEGAVAGAAEGAATGSASPGEPIRVWRTSHIGGHRFAPTLIDFPEGRYWAYADEDMLRKLIERKGSAAGIAGHLRGWSMIGRLEQVAERELFRRFGWDWIRYEKHAEVIQGDGESAPALVRIRYRSPEGVQGEYLAEVICSGKVRVGGCGGEWKETNQYSVRPLEDRFAGR